MASDTVVVARMREEKGSSAAGRMRAAGRLPASINDSEGRSLAIDLDCHSFMMMLRHHSGESLLLDVDIEGEKKCKALLKEVQRDPVSGNLLHADFKEISMTERLRVPVTIELLGEPAGVNEGGLLEHLLREVEVECLPTDLVEVIEIDVSAMNIGDHLLVNALQAPAGITIVTPSDVAIASVAAPRVEEVAETEAEEGEAGAEEAVGETTGEEQGKEEKAKE